MPRRAWRQRSTSAVTCLASLLAAVLSPALFVQASAQVAPAASVTLTPATKVAPPPRAAATPPGPPAKAPKKSHRTTLRASLDPLTHVVTAEGQTVFTNTSSKPVDELFVHLYLNAFKNDETAFLRSRLGDGRGDARPTSWGHIDIKRLALVGDGGASVDLWASADRAVADPLDETDARLKLPAPLAPGHSITLDMAFESKLPSIIERTGFVGSFHMVAQWFPKLAVLEGDGTWTHFAFHRLSEFYADFGDYDVTVDVPAAYVVGATGRAESTELKGARKVTRFVQRDVHDFAWTAWDRFVERSAAVDSVQVRVLAPPDHAGVLDDEIAAASLALRCYGARFGPYPYETLTIVRPAPGAEEAGGMEYPTLITTGGRWYGLPRTRAIEALTVHETGHQWFYGLLASDEHHHPFLDEGLNSYAESVCLGERHGAASAVDLPGLPVSIAAFYRESAIGAGHDDAPARDAASFALASHYGKLVYGRTASLLRTLGGAFGVDVVDRALARYAAAHRYGHPRPEDLIAAFEAEGGPRLADALRAGLYDRATVDFAALELHSARASSSAGVYDAASGRETRQGAALEGAYSSWAIVSRRGALSLPVDIELTFADGGKQRVRWDGDASWVRIEARSGAELTHLVVDPDHRIELDEQLTNNAISSRRQGFGSHTLEKATYWLSLAAMALLP